MKSLSRMLTRPARATAIAAVLLCATTVPPMERASLKSLGTAQAAPRAVVGPMAAPVPVAHPSTAPRPAGPELPPPDAIQEPDNLTKAVQLAALFIQLVNIAVRLGTLTGFAMAGLAGVYLAMFLVKSALKRAIPENYKSLLGTTLGVLTVIASVLAYFVGGSGIAGVVSALATAVGAAASGPLHRVIDGIAGLKPGRA